MKKLCCIFNIPSIYREAIYLDLDKTYDCEWYFERESNDIAHFNTKNLKKCHYLNHGKFIGRFYRMKGLVRLLWKRKDFDAYLMVGAPMCISIWILCILLKIFHPKKKIYFWTHGWYGKETFLERIVKKRFLKLADGIFLYGNYAKELLIERGFKKEKLYVLHNSLSYNIQLSLRKQNLASNIYRDYFGNDAPVLIFIGRLTKVKKLEMLLDALYILNQRGERYNLVFVGDGSEKESLKFKVETLNLSEQVWFYGSCFDEKKNAELVYNADLCVAPGNIGLTAIHSLMFGCPALTHGDFKYQMPEFEAITPMKTGNFFERNNTNALADSIVDWFHLNYDKREEVRLCCYHEIDSSWNPEYQMSIFRRVILDR